MEDINQDSNSGTKTINNSATTSISRKSKTLVTISLVVILLIITGIYLISKGNHKNTIKHSIVTKSEIKPTSAISPTVGYTQLDLKPINEGDIALLENNKAYLLDTRTMQKRELPVPNINSSDFFSFSKNGNILFADSYRKTGGVDFIIYNMAINKAVTIPHIGDLNAEIDSPNDISPNNFYFIVTQQCCPGDAGKTIVSLDGKIIKRLTGGAASWSPDSSTLAISAGNIVIELPLGPPPANSSIYLEKIAGDTINEKELVKATYQESFTPIQWKDNHTLLIKKKTFDKPFPEHLGDQDPQTFDYWLKVYENPTISYFTMDTDTLSSSPSSYTETQAINTVTYFSSFSSDKKWKLFKEGNSFDGPTYISRIDGSYKIKISDKAFAIWRPVLHQ